MPFVSPFQGYGDGCDNLPRATVQTMFFGPQRQPHTSLGQSAAPPWVARAPRTQALKGRNKRGPHDDATEASGHNILDHFADVGKMVVRGMEGNDE
jgi:hypothetical protein